MLSLSIAASAAVLGGSSATASQGETPRFEEITVEAGSNNANSPSDADRQARRRARTLAREVCRENGGRPKRVEAARLSNDRASATKYHAVWSATVRCEYPDLSDDETRRPPG